MGIIDAYTEKTFLEKLNSLYPERDYEIISRFVRGDLRILIEGKYGICSVIAKTLLKGAKCGILTAVDKASYRINMFKEVHNNLYEYPNYIYRDNSQLIEILCKEHGIQTVVESCHMKGHGCKGCTRIGAAPLTNKEFLQRVKEIGTEIEILEDIKGYHIHILCRNKYGFFRITPGHLLKGMSGSLRSAVDKTSYMIEQFKEKHDNKYTYPNYEYCGNRCLGKIECSSHGEFLQCADIHLMGSGCIKCGQENRLCGFRRSEFIEIANGRECLFYIIKCYNENEEFIKLGISSHTVKKRYKDRCLMPYNYEILYEFKSFDAGYIWDTELQHKRKYKEYRYEPFLYFKGITESFAIVLPIEEIIENLKQIE